MPAHQEEDRERKSSDTETAKAEELHRAVTKERDASPDWRGGCRDDCRERKQTARFDDESLLPYFSASA